MEQENKSIWKSKTMWINLLMAIPGVLTFVMDNDMFPITPELYTTLILVVNFTLRLMTDKPVSFKLNFKKLRSLNSQKDSKKQNRQNGKQKGNS